MQVFEFKNIEETKQKLEELRTQGYTDCRVDSIDYDAKSDYYKVTLTFWKMYVTPGTSKASFKATPELIEFISVNQLLTLSNQKGTILSIFKDGKLDLVYIKY